MKHRIRNKPGITLITLVITIIVLLILAGVSISMITSQDGILKKTTAAKETTYKATEKEKISRAFSSGVIEKYEKNEDIVSLANFKYKIYGQKGNSFTIIDNGDTSFTVVTDDNEEYEYIVKQNGEVTEMQYEKWNLDVTEPTEKTNSEIHIKLPSELKWLANQVNDGNSFKGYTIYLDNNLDFFARKDESGQWENSRNEQYSWIPIGLTYANRLEATFDGNGHTIKGIYVTLTDKYGGIFGNANTIRNLIVKSSYIKSTSTAGGIAGAIREGILENCYNINTEVIVTAEQAAGGLVGQFTGTNITKCYNTGKILTEGKIAGGIVGLSKDGNIENCYNIGNVSGKNQFISGVIGYIANEKSFNIFNCYNLGNIEGDKGCVSGVVSIVTGEQPKIENCYNAGDIRGNGEIVGGLLGWMDCNNMTVKSCYNKGEVVNGGKFTSGVLAYATKANEITIENCYNVGNVTGEGMFTSGVVSTDNSGTVKKCYNTGNINGKSDFIGGVVALNNENSKIEECYNNGNVDGTADGTGGVAGASSGNVLSCYNTGKVTNTTGERVGGIMGELQGTVSLCYNKGEVIGNKCVGGIVGIAFGNISECYNNGNIEGVTDSVGGVTGSSSGNILSCYNTGTVKDTTGERVGGIAGNLEGTISLCYNKGKIIGNQNVGGVIGITFGNISECYNEGSVISTGYGEIGGICGQIGMNHAVIIENCYNTGDIIADASSTAYIGGILGWLSQTGTSGKIINNYNIGKIVIKGSGNSSYSGIIGRIVTDSLSKFEIANNYFIEGTLQKGSNIQGQSKRGEEMKTKDFAELLGMEKWQIISSKNNGYPILKNIKY